MKDCISIPLTDDYTTDRAWIWDVCVMADESYVKNGKPDKKLC